MSTKHLFDEGVRHVQVGEFVQQIVNPLGRCAALSRANLFAAQHIS
jgi:hypothetical protein